LAVLAPDVRTQSDAEMIATRLHFIQELASVDEGLMRMGSTVGSMIASATSAFLESDVSRVPKVLADDNVVDMLEEEIETTCLRLLATQQPMARDLRRISSAIKVASELERIGDHAVEIAKNSRKLMHRCFCPRPLVDIEPMHKAVQSMLSDSLAAFVNHDVELVRDVCKHDDIVDDMFRVSRDDLFQLAQEDGSLVAAASYTLLVLVSLERIADHSTNIAERVNYIETGDLSRIAHEHKRIDDSIAPLEASGSNGGG
jgi:phosphate transport system protein